MKHKKKIHSYSELTQQKKEPFFRRVKNKISDTINIYRQINLDRKYRKEYKKRIAEFALAPTSDFVKFGLKIGSDQETLSSLVQLPNEFSLADEYTIYEKLNDITIHITNYLRDVAGFNFYVSLPEFYHLEEPGRPDNLSLSYIAVWNFQPMIQDDRRKKYMGWLYGISAFLICGITGLVLGLTL